MTTLTEFLLARISEAEAIAQAASSGPWKVDNEIYAEAIYQADGYSAVVSGGKWRVLAECEAKRRIVTRLIAERDGVEGEPTYCMELAGDLLAEMAMPYADHPDYGEDWKP